MALASPSLDGVSLLVTDDHADSADLLEMVLTARGATVKTSYSPRDTLALLGGFKPDALLLDISMPEMDGYALLGHIRDLPGLAAVPAIAVTGHARERDREKAKAAGFTVHTAKPVDAEAIVYLLAELLKPRGAPVVQPAIAELERLLSSGGLVEVLRVLNARAGYRFTGVYRYEGPTLRCLALIDREDPTVVIGGDAQLDTTFCGVVRRDREGFVTNEGRAAPRAAGLPLREDIRSYCGALLRHPDGKPYGSLCHFDLERQDVRPHDLALLEAFAPSLATVLAADAF